MHCTMRIVLVLSVFFFCVSVNAAEGGGHKAMDCHQPPPKPVLVKDAGMKMMAIRQDANVSNEDLEKLLHQYNAAVKADEVLVKINQSFEAMCVLTSKEMKK